MIERDFRTRLIQEFKKVGGQHRFIWSHDAHFKSGYPDLEWVVRGMTGHAELKLCKEPSLPRDMRDLCTKIQLHVMNQMHEAGAYVRIFVLHAPPRGEKKGYIVQMSGDFSAFTYDGLLQAWKIKTS